MSEQNHQAKLKPHLAKDREPQPPQPYYWFDEGCGAVIKLKRLTSAQDTTRVGTTNVHTCVGVYFRIDDELCFAAHMRAHFLRTTNKPKNVIDDWVPTAKEGEELEALVLKLLKATLEVAKPGWRPDSKVKDDTIIVCRRSRTGPMIDLRTNEAIGERTTGSYMVAAVRTFLELEDTPLDYRIHGFVKDHFSGSERLLQWFEEDGETPEELGYIKDYLPYDSLMSWDFIYDDVKREWLVTAIDDRFDSDEDADEVCVRSQHEESVFDILRDNKVKDLEK